MNKLMKVISCSLLMSALTLQSFGQTVIKLKRHGNVYILPCRVNGLLLDMFFDTGADDVSLSLTEAQTMIEKGYLTENDIIGKQSYTTASGSIAEGTKINIRKITFAGLEINNVAATVMHTTDAPLLFGQSAIRMLGKIQIDPSDNSLTIFKGKGTYDYSNGSGDGNDDEVIAKNNTQKDEPHTSSEKFGYDDNSNKTTNNKAVVTSLTATIRLKIDRPGGANGASVAWHPVLRKYYAAMAGNFTFPMEIFDASGRMTSPDDLQTMFDVRGLWYNPYEKTFQANGYNDFGWAQYIIDGNGLPKETTKLDVPSTQPDVQSVGAYDSKNDVLYFYDMQAAGVEPHRLKDGAVYRTIPLYLGSANKSDVTNDRDELKYNYNQNALIYTGISKAEVGLLNVAARQVELYDISTGLMTRALRLPDSAPVESSLNFSYCNGIYWLFDKQARIWLGYK